MADDERFNRRACDKRFETIEHDVDILERDAKNNLKSRESIQEKIGALYGHIDSIRVDLLTQQSETASDLSDKIAALKARVTFMVGGALGIAGILSLVMWIIDKVHK